MTGRGHRYATPTGGWPGLPRGRDRADVEQLAMTRPPCYCPRTISRREASRAARIGWRGRGYRSTSAISGGSASPDACRAAEDSTPSCIWHDAGRLTFEPLTYRDLLAAARGPTDLSTWMPVTQHLRRLERPIRVTAADGGARFIASRLSLRAPRGAAAVSVSGPRSDGSRSVLSNPG